MPYFEFEENVHGFKLYLKNYQYYSLIIAIRLDTLLATPYSLLVRAEGLANIFASIAVPVSSNLCIVFLESLQNAQVNL